MKRSQLREVIKSIVSRKLAENSGGEHGRDIMTATYVKNHAEWDDFDRVKVITHYGSHELEVVECWVDKSNKTLMLSVQADVPPNLEEDTTTTTSTTNTSGTTTDSSQQQSQDDGDQMSDSDRLQITNLQKQQAKLTNDSQRIEGAISKLREPLERKVGQLEKRKADIQRKLGTVTDKIKRIQDKYSKVFENLSEDGMHLTQNPKFTFSVAFDTHIKTPKLDKVNVHKIEAFPANSKEELPQAIQAWLDGYVRDAAAKGRTDIVWKLLPKTLQVFSQYSLKENRLPMSSADWARAITQDIHNVVGQNFSGDTFSEKANAVFVLLDASDVKAVSVTPNGPISMVGGKLPSNVKYKLEIYTTDNKRHKFENLTHEEVMKHIRFYTK